jgi:signal transduction histidine kinase
MQKSDDISSDTIVHDLSQVATEAYKELERTRHDLREKEMELKEIAEQSNQKINAAAKLNSELQGKTQMLMDLSTQLKEQNEELQDRNKQLEIKEGTYNSLNRELREELEKILKQERDLELQKQYLEKQIQDKSSEVSKAEKMATIGELTSRLAHDLRNPLTVLKSAHAVMKEKPNLKVKERLQYNDKIDRAILKIVHLVDDVLDYVRISELDLNQIPVSAILDSAIDSIDVPSSVKINYEKTDAEINCDIRKMEAVFSNIITNSIQAMGEDGEIEINVSSKNDNVTIQFQDTGPGMTESVIKKIYDPLFTTKSHGTGLGLSICKTIVEQHGGKITVKSNPTTFTVTLPQNL